MARPKGTRKIVEKVKEDKIYQYSEAALPESIELVASAPYSRSSSALDRGSSALGETKETRFPYINKGLTPYTTSEGYISVRDAIDLCQKAYFNFAAFRNTIDIMSEFTNSPIHWVGGNKVSRKFFETWADAINLWGINDRAIRELYRGGQVFMLRLDTTLTPDDINGYKQIKGQIQFDNDNKLYLPRGYMILNTMDIAAEQGLNYLNPKYFWSISHSQAQKILAQHTQQDKDFYKSLTSESKNALKGMAGRNKVYLPIDPSYLYSVFYKKQDYEPLAVPFGYSVLDSINLKLQLQQIDIVLSRTMEQIIFLITTGTEPDKGGINPRALDALKNAFKSESLGRVIVADYTTKAEFIVPAIGEILGPKKYEQVDKDIREGLLMVFVGEDKFSNSMTKIKVFMKRLENTRRIYLNEFLIPEVKRIHKMMGFRGGIPTPIFEQEDLKDEAVYARIYTSLLQAGALTPSETFNALNDGVLPDEETSVENQKKLKDWKDEGLYLPAINTARENGRPEGTGKPIPNRKTRVLGSDDKELYAIDAIAEVYKKTNLILAKFGEKYCKDNKKKKITSEIQDEVFARVKSLFYNENWNDWESLWEDYYSKPKLPNQTILQNVAKITQEHGVEELMGVILWNAKEENYTGNINKKNRAL